jgi:hypothetical protein
MSEIRIKFLIIYIIAVLCAYLLKKYTYRIAQKAIKEERLSSGIYHFYPVEGKKAVELAQGYIRGINIYFWFNVLFFPMMFVLFLLFDAI